MMGSIGDMAYLASRSDVLMASQAIFHLTDHITRLDGLCERQATPRDYARRSPWVGHFRPAIPDFAIARKRAYGSSGLLAPPSAERQEFGERAGLSVSQPNDNGLELTFDAGNKDHLISAVLDWICVHLFYSRENVDPVAIDFERHATIPLAAIEGAFHGARAAGELAVSGLRFVRKGRD